MKVLLIITAFLLASAYGGVIKSNAKCEAQRFSKCSDTFAKALGLSEMPKDPKVIDDQVKKLIGQGNKKQVCDAAAALQQCLGDESDDCMTVDFLKSIGISESDAKAFIEGAQQTLKLCSSLIMFKSNGKCEVGRFAISWLTFTKALGLPELFSDQQAVDDQIKKLLAEGKKKQVCDAASALQQGLGDEADDCVNVDFLKSIGVSDADAKTIVRVVKDTSKLCSSSLVMFKSNAKCELARFNPCSDTFVKALGLTKLPGDPKVVDAQIKKLLAEGKKKQVCDAASALEQCLGDEAEDCVTVEFLKSIGVSDADAKLVVQGVQDTLKLCSSRFVMFNSNAKCEVERFSKCSDTFAKLLGLPALPDDPKVIEDQIQKLLKEGKKKQVCDATVGLQRCLGDEFDDCETVDFLKSIGVSEADAKAAIDGFKQALSLCV